MTLTKLFYKLWLSAAALLAFSACSSEDLPTQTASEAPKTKQIQVNISAGRDMDAMRAIFGLTTDGSGATTGLEMPEKDVMLRIAVKRGVNGTPIYQTIQFKKQIGRNYAIYNGSINVPTDGSGDYLITAVHMSDVNGETYATIGGPNDSYAVFGYGSYAASGGQSQPVKKTTDNKLNIAMAYATQWQKIGVLANNTAEPVTLKLAPVGSLLRMRIKNETAVTQSFTGLRITSNAVGYGGFFSFSESFLSGPLFRPNNLGYANFNLTGISVEPNQHSEWLYVWVFPRNAMQETPITRFFLRSSVSGYGTFRSVYETNQAMPQGSIPITLVYRDGHDAEWADLPESPYEFGKEVGIPKLSIDYLAEAPINQAGTAFTTNIAEVGYFDMEASKPYRNIFTIDGKNYSLPTANEMASIVPRVMGATGPYIPYNESPKNLLEKNITIGGITGDYLADYTRVGEVSYAVRFRNSTNYNRTAFRFRYLDENGINWLKIEAIYLGTSTEDITTIANPTFWTTNENKITSRQIPLYGNKKIYVQTGISAEPTTSATEIAAWTASSLDVSSGYVGVFSVLGYSYMTVYASHDAVAIIPFRRD